jgi:hypothetical protein
MKKILLFCGVLTSLFTHGQRELPVADDNINKYLNDGKNTDPEADVRLALSSSFSGFFEIMYEQKISNSLGAEVSIAPKVWRGLDFWDILVAENNNYPSDTFSGGYGYSGTLKWYPNEDAICDMAYYAVSYRGRTHKYNSSVYKTNDIFLSMGVKYLISNSISADVALSMGPRFYKYSPTRPTVIDNPDFFFDPIEKYKGTMFYGGLRFGFGYYINYKK